MEPDETILCGVCGRFVTAVGYLCPRCGTDYTPLPYVPATPEELDAERKRYWAAFWADLAPEEVAAALRAAPRVAGEWKDVGGIWMRDGQFKTDDVGTIIDARECVGDDLIVYVLHIQRRGWRRDQLAEAKSAADAALRQAGWVLLP